jgi:PAS domain S-box-containing protein
MNESFSGTSPIRILHLEENRNDRSLVQESLRAAGAVCEFHPVSSEAEFETALAARTSDLIIADYPQPSPRGEAVLAAARRIRPELPFIFVAKTMSAEQVVECLRSGAADCILKQRLELLGPAAQRAMRDAEEHLRWRRGEEALKQSEERFREMAENIREVFWSASPDGRELLYVSPAYEQIWQRPLIELHARPASRIEAALPEDRPSLLQALEGLGRGIPFSLEYRIAWPDGTVRWIEDRGYPVPSRHPGEVKRAVGVAIDVTERKQLEEQLRQAQKMEAIGQLAGGIAHDFSNMLTVINGRSRLLLDTTTFPPEIAESIRQIYIAGERAARLTRQLLVFSRKQFMHSQLVDLNEITEEVVKMLRSMIAENIGLELNLATHPLAVIADASMLEQVLMNLALNARDAMPQGGRLRITTEVRDITSTDCRRNPDAVPGRHVCLEVRDSGCGIPAVNLPRIFEPFFTTKEIGKGTGLGLSTVFGIIKHHHGWVEVESTVGVGTVFKVFLPLSAEHLVQTETTPVEATVLGGKETILLVEDETTVRDFASAVMQQYGYRVLQASSGAEALEVWQWNAPKISLLLTDLVMPDELTGIELAKKLQAEKPELKVIFASGYSPDTSRPGFASLKGMNFLHKPYPPRALALMLREVLDRQKVAVVR